LEGTAKAGETKRWPPGQLVREIEETFKDAAPGEYYAVIVEVSNPISGYRVVKIPVG
jgi:hypothetical protein